MPGFFCSLFSFSQGMGVLSNTYFIGLLTFKILNTAFGLVCLMEFALGKMLEVSTRLQKTKIKA